MTRAAARAGFSLVEMLAVLAIVALIAGIGAQFARRPSPRLRVESAARALCAGLRTTRTRAIAANAEQALTIDMRRKTFFSPTVVATALPEDAAIEATVSHRDKRGATLAAIAFFPSGGSSGGEVSILLDGVRAEIVVNWLTGATRCAIR